MSVSSAVWNSLMNSAQVVCIDQRLDQPFADVESTRELHDAVGEIDELDALIGLHDDRLAVNRKAADRSPKPPLRQASRER